MATKSALSEAIVLYDDDDNNDDDDDRCTVV